MDHLSYNATGGIGGGGWGEIMDSYQKENSCLAFLEEENTLQGRTV